MVRVHEIAAVFPTQVAARAAVDELCERNLAAPALRVAADQGSRRWHERQQGGVWGRAVLIGMAAGIPVGALLAAALVYFAAAVDGGVSAAALVAGAVAGVVLGLFGGGVAGALWGNASFEEGEHWDLLDLADDEVLVVARAAGQRDAVTEVLRRHGARLTDHLGPAPAAQPASL